MPEKHSTLPRGLEAAGHADKLQATAPFGSKFGRLFPDLPAATFGDTKPERTENLTKLAAAMISKFDAPKDGPDGEESGIPALYTYFGQFIDHDLTFDPNGSFAKQKDASAVNDFRTAAFDLDNLYGRGPGDQPYMYEDDGRSLRLGNPITLGFDGARDLQRNEAGRALIGDPRNDENSIVSQFQGLMIRFHNSVVAKNPKMPFEQVQEIVRHHYQYVVLNDFLPRIVNKAVLDKLRGPDGHFDRAKLKFFRAFDHPFMPVEFSVAAYRLGHSMVRPGYRLNDATLVPIFPLAAKDEPGFPEGLTGFRRLISDWGIDWGRLIDLDVRAYGIDPDTVPKLDPKQKADNFKRLQFAYRIDTALVHPLGNLPMPVAGNNPLSLALRNLERGVEFSLPSGQTVAKAMGEIPLEDDKIGIGAAEDGAHLDSITTIADVFKGNCPLWVYILAEAVHHKAVPDPTLPVVEPKHVTTPQLGPVGGRIVAEVFLGLMFADSGSYLVKNPTWAPTGDFKLKDLVAAAIKG